MMVPDNFGAHDRRRLRLRRRQFFPAGRALQNRHTGRGIEQDDLLAPSGPPTIRSDLQGESRAVDCCAIGAMTGRIAFPSSAV